jgi:hypothetical protein
LFDVIVHYLRENIENFVNYSPSSTAGNYNGHIVEVSLDFKKISLYIDGQLVETSRVYLWPSKESALLRGVINEGRSKHIVHVYGMSGLFRASIKICVDGKRIAGEDF